MRVLLLLLACSSLGWAAPRLNIVDTSINAPGDVTHAVSVTVTVENRGDEAADGANVDVICTPQVPKADRTPGGMTDVLSVRVQLPQIPPGGRVTAKADTPYMSSSSFKSQHGTFRASNVMPSDPSMIVKVESKLAR